MQNLIIEGKDPNRVPKYYKMGSDDWVAEYNMLLPDGVTCASCSNCTRCCAIFGQKETYTYCQFHPNRFSPIKSQSKTTPNE